jgi:N-glycosylase/DNA lyase
MYMTARISANFNLAQTLDNGQAFRWEKITENHFSGIAHGRRLEIFHENETITLKNVTPAEFEKTWKNYFDLNRDYGELCKKLAFSCEHLRKAIEFSPGLRMLNQDPWEVLISFILSQNSNIPRIKKMVEALCQNFGEALPCGGYAFPAPAALAALHERDLAPIRAGYRAAYILDAARQVESGTFDPAALQNAPTEEIKTALQKIHGVGPKVADCVLLFGFSRIEIFPLDVWMKRVMSSMYPSGFPPEIKEYAGLAQQFLFHYARNVKTAGLSAPHPDPLFEKSGAKT